MYDVGERDVEKKIHALISDNVLINTFISFLCDKNYTVILFGSRARSDFTSKSDYDILVIGGEEPPLPSWHMLDLHFVRREEVERKTVEFHPIVIDALYEGKVICDNLHIHEEFRQRVMERTAGLRKSKEGWMKDFK